MSYEDIVAVRQQRAEREAVKKGKQTVERRNGAGMARHEVTSPHLKEVQVAEADICTMELEWSSKLLRRVALLILCMEEMVWVEFLCTVILRPWYICRCRFIDGVITSFQGSYH